MNIKLFPFVAMVATAIALTGCEQTPKGTDDGVIAAKSVTIDNPDPTIEVGGTTTITATVLPEKATNTKVAWSIENSQIATIDIKTGEVKGISVGSTIATVTTADGGHKATCTVTVTIHATGVSLTKTTMRLKIDDTETLEATVAPEGAVNKNVTWSSDAENIATVDPKTGEVKAIAEGTATITATTEDGGFKESCVVTSGIFVTGVSIDGSNPTLAPNEGVTLKATLSPANATNQNVTWSTSNAAVAAVNPKTGEVTAVSVGTATITVTTEDGTKTATKTVTVTIGAAGVSIDKETLSLKVGGSETLRATVSPGNTVNKSVKWSSSNTDVATVGLTSGEVKGVRSGTATITVTTDDGGKTATCIVTVNPILVEAVTLDRSTFSLKTGTSDRLQASILPTDATNQTVRWSSSAPDIVWVNYNTGELKARSEGEATVTATANDDSGKSASCVVNSRIPVTDISLDNTFVSLLVGENKTLVATLSPVNATNKKVTWSSSAPAIATVEPHSGEVTAVHGGKATITATTDDGSRKAVCTVKIPHEPEMVFVDGGTFWMGSDDGGWNEKPVHQVTLSSFQIGKYEVTQAEWNSVMFGSNPSYFKGDDLPMEYVNCADVEKYISRLNQLTGKHYALPTEAQWEYAARGGNKSKGFTYSGGNNLSDVGWYGTDSTHPVGKKSPNELGIYDMSGNVYEWCSDEFSLYSVNWQTNPTVPPTGWDRMARGGCWYYELENTCRVADRSRFTPDICSKMIGFRLVLLP